MFGIKLANVRLRHCPCPKQKTNKLKEKRKKEPLFSDIPIPSLIQ